MSLLQSQFDLHLQYRWGLYGYWGAILAIGIGIRLIKLVFTQRYNIHDGDVEGDTTTPDSKRRRGPPFTWFKSLSHAIATYLTIPPAFGSHHQRLFWWCYVPTRLETIVVLAYWILNLVLCCVSFRTTEPSIQASTFPVSFTSPEQLYRFIADRTGVMAISNLPMLWIFSLRNNCFIWLTGWSFSTFMTFHRHISRIVLIQVIVHASTYSAYQAAFNYLAISWNERYWQMGAVAIIAVGLIHISSSIYLRIKFYDLFLILHIVLAVIFVAGLFYHLDLLFTNYTPYIWPLVAFWVFDRFVRILRLVACNIGLSRGSIGHQAVATYSKEFNLIRLEVTTPSNLLKPRAGQHYFLYQPLRWRGWESHPFSLAAWTTDAETGDKPANSKIDQGPKDVTEKEQSNVATTSADDKVLSQSPVDTPKDDESSISSGQTQGKKLTFYIRPRDGWTKQLREQCSKDPSGSVGVTALIEGPYGLTIPIHTLEHVLFVVGGSGITVALSYLQDYAGRTSSRHNGSSKTPSTQTRQLTLVWTARQTSMIRDIAARELQSFSRREDVHIRLFSTTEEPSSHDDVSNDEEKPDEQEPALQISNGRPSVKNEISRVINDVCAVDSRGIRIAVMACGPPAMADEARGAVHDALKEGKDMVEYFEEKFGW